MAAGILATGLLSASSLVLAQAPSARPLVIRVAYPAGGPANVATRKIQIPLQAALGRPVVIENLPGAGGSIAANSVLNAAADGQTLLVTTGNDMILSPLALAGVKYKPEQYRLLATILPSDFTLVTNAGHAFTTLDDLIEKARRSSEKGLVKSTTYGRPPIVEMSRSAYERREESRKSRATVGLASTKPGLPRSVPEATQRLYATGEWIQSLR
jgi:tripartite-type tricarboxylate transporter receptor subunit TctC